MRYWIILVLAIFLLIGCKTAEKSYEYYQRCMNDKECAEEVRLAQSVADESVQVSVREVKKGAGVAELLGGIVGTVFGFGLGVLKGKHIKKVI